MIYLLLPQQSHMNLDLLVAGGEIHKKVQEYAKTELVKSGTKLWDIAENIETRIKQYTSYDIGIPLAAGIAFPTGVNVNTVAAHWSPNPRDTHQRLGKSDIVKVDFGVHLQGHILDGAFSYTENPDLQPLVECSIEATNTGISAAGIDANLGEIGGDIQEVIESYEIVVNGNVYPVTSTRDLCGHQIAPYKIHCGKVVPNVKLEYAARMNGGEEYAIETFPTTGSGRIRSDTPNTSHYMLERIWNVDRIKPARRGVYNDITRRFGTLAFCRRWLNYNPSELEVFENLVESKVIKQYPPLYDTTPGAYVAQTEHSIFITEDGRKIVLN